MAVYHISKDGDPSLCTAHIRACPLGGEHFTSLVDAKNYLEAQELKRNKGSFSEVFSKSKRKRMFDTHPKMTYTVNIDDSVYDSSGNEWIVTSKVYGRSNDRDHSLPTLGLAKVPSGEEVVINPYDPNTATIEDFSMPTPSPVILDGAPVRDSKKFSALPKGKTTYNNVLVQTVPVNTVLGKDYGGRYLIVEKNNDKNYYTQKEMLEVGEAMWKQTGRDLSLWAAKSKQDKLKYFEWNTAEYKRLKVDNNGSRVKLMTFNQLNEAYPVSSEPIATQDIVKYSL